jgi:murein DD-endopeptidase MepM/ murein hydrolase activator NlpD
MQPIRNAQQGGQQLEAILLKQLLQESKVLQGGATAGSGLYAEMFCEALANAVAQGGGLGIAQLVEGSFANLEETYDESAGLSGPNLQGGYLVPGAESTSAAPTAEPSEKPRVSSPYGQRVDPINGTQRFHSGIDVAAEEGASIIALSSGVVRQAGRRGAYGNAVEIDTGRGLSMLYGHASQLAVEEGERVEKGQVIGAVGHTGRATGPHLHFEVRKDGVTTNPESTLNRLGERADVMIGRKTQHFGNGDKP